jgi:hypothetical protein
MNNIHIKSTPAFDRKTDKLISKEALDDFLDHISKYPNEGKVITGTGGVRKIRWNKGG